MREFISKQVQDSAVQRTGDLLLDPVTNQLKAGDGVTPGGKLFAPGLTAAQIAAGVTGTVGVDSSGNFVTPTGVVGASSVVMIASAALASTTGTAGVIYQISDGADAGAKLCWATPQGASTPSWCWWLWPQAAY